MKGCCTRCYWLDDDKLLKLFWRMATRGLAWNWTNDLRESESRRRLHSPCQPDDHMILKKSRRLDFDWQSPWLTDFDWLWLTLTDFDWLTLMTLIDFDWLWLTDFDDFDRLWLTLADFDWLWPTRKKIQMWFISESFPSSCVLPHHHHNFIYCSLRSVNFFLE